MEKRQIYDQKLTHTILKLRLITTVHRPQATDPGESRSEIPVRVQRPETWRDKARGSGPSLNT